MKRDTKIGALIALATVIAALLGVLLSISRIQPVLGGILIGVVFGVGVARGDFSFTRKLQGNFRRSKMRAEG